MRIDHVQLSAPAGCEGAARDFFCGLLGMEEIEKPGALRARGGCWFSSGDANIHIGVENDFRPAKKAHPAIAVPDLDAWAAKFGDAVEWDDLIPGVRRFYVHDPWGNRLEFLEESTP
jgi:catechol 2,3-dioxygenase-like lactoylglutathione lyase family enzyme